MSYDGEAPFGTHGRFHGNSLCIVAFIDLWLIAGGHLHVYPESVNWLTHDGLLIWQHYDTYRSSVGAFFRML